MTDLAARKAALRVEARGLAAAPPAADEALLERLLALRELRESTTVALFAALPGEPPVERLGPALRARGWRTAYPRIAGEGLQLHRVAEESELVAGSRVREPPSGAPAVEPVSVGLWLVPGLLFAPDGARLGRGGGHYDRLLAHAAPGAPRIGICYADRVRAELPTAPHDQRVDAVATQDGVLRVSARAARGAS